MIAGFDSAWVVSVSGSVARTVSPSLMSLMGLLVPLASRTGVAAVKLLQPPPSRTPLFAPLAALTPLAMVRASRAPSAVCPAAPA